MKLAIIIASLTLAGCGKFQDSLRTGIDGHAVKCVDGTKYIVMSSDRGLAITPHVGTDGKPKGCDK